MFQRTCQIRLNSRYPLKNTKINNLALEIVMHRQFQQADRFLVFISSENMALQPYINSLSSQTTVGKFGKWKEELK